MKPALESALTSLLFVGYWAWCASAGTAENENDPTPVAKIKNGKV